MAIVPVMGVTSCACSGAAAVLLALLLTDVLEPIGAGRLVFLLGVLLSVGLLSGFAGVLFAGARRARTRGEHLIMRTFAAFAILSGAVALGALSLRMVFMLLVVFATRPLSRVRRAQVVVGAAAGAAAVWIEYHFLFVEGAVHLVSLALVVIAFVLGVLALSQATSGREGDVWTYLAATGLFVGGVVVGFVAIAIAMPP